jgi:N,N'-diacetyllegionaminate synthase
MRIGTLDTADRVIIIAEIGNNHEGDFAVAERLIREAAAAGADAVKFQVFRAEHLAGTGNPARLAQLKSYELSIRQFREISELAHSEGLLFVATAFDPEIARDIGEFTDAYKVASGDNSFYPLLGVVARSGKPLMISTGSSDRARVALAVSHVEAAWRERGSPGELALLHCVSCYPVPPEQANLLAIPFLAGEFGYTVGYSDHTLGIQAPVMAVALGARILEKHFTLSRSHSSFRDHQLSADPPEMKELVKRVREASLMLGGAGKALLPCEAESAGAIRRSIVAASDLPEGHSLLPSDLAWTRPAGGLAPGEEHRLIGRRLRHPVRSGDRLTGEDVR